MNDTQKMLQAIIHGQNALKQALGSRIDQLDKKISGGLSSLEQEVHDMGKNLTNRIDRLGKSLAYLEDDAPTREEFDQLEKRVDKIQHKTTPI